MKPGGLIPSFYSRAWRLSGTRPGFVHPSSLIPHPSSLPGGQSRLATSSGLNGGLTSQPTSQRPSSPAAQGARPRHVTQRRGNRARPARRPASLGVTQDDAGARFGRTEGLRHGGASSTSHGGTAAVRAVRRGEGVRENRHGATGHGDNTAPLGRFRERGDGNDGRRHGG